MIPGFYLSDGDHMTILFPLANRHHAKRIAIFTVTKYMGIFTKGLEGDVFVNQPQAAKP